NPRLGDDRLNSLSGVRGTRRLCDDEFAANSVEEREISEGSADIDAHSVAHCRTVVAAAWLRHSPHSERPKRCSYSDRQISEHSTTCSPASPVASIRSARRWII